MLPSRYILSVWKIDYGEEFNVRDSMLEMKLLRVESGKVSNAIYIPFDIAARREIAPETKFVE